MAKKNIIEEIDFLDEDANTNIPKISVSTPTGASVPLLNQDEKDYYERIAQRYLSDNHFTNISDLQELDRVLVLETMSFRWSNWLLEEQDYFGEPIDVVGIQRNLGAYSKEIRDIKKDLGIDKSSRDKDKSDSVADYIEKLRQRAQEFGIVRNEQAVKAITILKEIQGKVQLFLNYDDTERNEFKWHEKDVIDWLISKFEEFDEIDKKFRETSQKYWIREQ